MEVDCKKVGHKKVDSLVLRGGAVNAPSPITLRIVVSHKGRARALSERTQSLQCQSRDARLPSDAIVGRLSFGFFLIIISIYFALGSCLGMGKNYLWFSSLLLPGLYHQELLYAILHVKSH